MDTGIVFDIKRFALHDGPGIRTTVFMKGCPLRCLWCHNPEGLQKKPFVDYRKESCLECGICIQSCPVKCIQKTAGGLLTDHERCLLCGKCVEACPAACRTMTGISYTPEALFAQIQRDQIFYGADGGVTFSGGEALEQAGFLIRVMKLCRDAGIHIALDTSGYAPREAFHSLLPYVNLYLYDIKHMDPIKHREYTGVDPERIELNLRYLAEKKCHIIVRLPIIPGYNNSPDNLQRIKDFLKDLPVIKQISLLPYHDTAKGKYYRLTGAYAMAQTKTPVEEEMQQIKAFFEADGFQVKTGG